MLFQITNNCEELCPHCLQCSRPSNTFMTMQTLVKALTFAEFLKSKLIVVSGGEPTSHPQFKEICEKISRMGFNFTICTNGSFIEDEQRTSDFKAVTRLKGYVCAQVYTHKDFYKNYEKRVSQRSLFESIKGVEFETHNIENMQDCGRAMTSDKAQEYIERQKHVMGCVNMTLISRQSVNAKDLVRNYNDCFAKVICKPLVDWKGNVHMSESMTCPSVGNVNDDYVLTIIANMRQFSPCLRCKNARYIFDDKYKEVRRILGI